MSKFKCVFDVFSLLENNWMDPEKQCTEYMNKQKIVCMDVLSIAKLLHKKWYSPINLTCICFYTHDEMGEKCFALKKKYSWWHDNKTTAAWGTLSNLISF